MGFEAHNDVGGLWDINNPRSTVYQTAHLISSKKMTEFREFPMAEALPITRRTVNCANISAILRPISG
ncbi:MAG: hypothetical protein R3C26_25105 [Calditrichia bacterium]